MQVLGQGVVGALCNHLFGYRPVAYVRERPVGIPFLDGEHTVVGVAEPVASARRKAIAGVLEVLLYVDDGCRRKCHRIGLCGGVVGVVFIVPVAVDIQTTIQGLGGPIGCGGIAVGFVCEARRSTRGLCHAVQRTYAHLVPVRGFVASGVDVFRRVTEVTMDFRDVGHVVVAGSVLVEGTCRVVGQRPLHLVEEVAVAVRIVHLERFHPSVRLKHADTRVVVSAEGDGHTVLAEDELAAAVCAGVEEDVRF